MTSRSRCSRCLWHPDYIRYHDSERGVPLHDEHKHFEMLALETQQAWLSWRIILQRREWYREVFANFDPTIIATWWEDRVEELVQDSRIIRNRRKISSIIHNAQAFLDIQSEYGLFDNYIWWFTDRQVIDNHRASEEDRLTRSDLSDRVSKDMKSRWFAFIGTTTVYAWLQAIGIINDHLTSCRKH